MFYTIKNLNKMKKILKYILAIIIGGFLFTSCQDPFANQTIAQPINYKQSAIQDTSFVTVIKTGINPVTVTDTNMNDSLALITVTSIPSLLDPNATVLYSLQISSTNDFSSFHVLPFAFNGKSGSDIKISYKNLNDTIYFMNSSANQRDVYVRVIATISKGGINSLLQSTVLKFQATPVPMKAFNLVTPNLWYIIGLGDGNWNYSAAGIGASMFPLSLVTGNAYNTAGNGTFTYTGYFKNTNGFKIVSGKTSDLGTWNVQWGSSDGKLTPVFKSASSSNFTVPTDGYYTISLNSIANTMSIVPTPTTSIPTGTYAPMALSGDFNGWSATANPMFAFGSTNNHQWYITVTITSDGGIKFNSNSWANSWGSLIFPNGFGVNNGPNIPITAGTYTALFNDIDDCYYFIAH